MISFYRTTEYIGCLYASLVVFQGAIMAAVSSSKWNTFYNDPPDMAEDDITSAGKYFYLHLCFIVWLKYLSINEKYIYHIILKVVFLT